jgi:hypothetical protein
VTATPTTCAWSATSNATWVTVTSGASGTGNGQFSFTVSANSGAIVRTGTITVVSQTVTVTQQGATLSPTQPEIKGNYILEIEAAARCGWPVQRHEWRIGVQFAAQVANGYYSTADIPEAPRAYGYWIDFYYQYQPSGTSTTHIPFGDGAFGFNGSKSANNYLVWGDVEARVSAAPTRGFDGRPEILNATLSSVRNSTIAAGLHLSRERTWDCIGTDVGRMSLRAVP